MLESGFIIALGLSFMFMKMGWRSRMRMLSHPLALDIAVFTLVTFLHWGTYSGVMAAAVAALLTSVLITLARKVWGYYEKGKYVRGMYDISGKLV